MRALAVSRKDSAMNMRNPIHLMSPRRLGAALLVICLLPAHLGAQEAAPKHLQVEAGTHELLKRDRAVVRVAVGNPDLAEVNVINRRELLVTGKAVGETSLLLWPQGASDPDRLRLQITPGPVGEHSPDPDLAKAQIRPGAGMSGPLPNLMAHRRAKARAQAGAERDIADDTVIEMETQVLTEIKIAEVSRRTAQRYGFNLSRNTGNSIGAIVGPGGLNAVERTGGGFGIDSTLVPLNNAFNLVLGDASDGILGVLSLLESRGMARTLAEPSLTATSGQTASFLAGGEFPVPVSQGGAAAGGITVEFKEFGVRLNLTPTILSRDRISLKVAPEVSELDFTAGIEVGGTSVPALTTRRTDTTVELGDGESFVISGLVSSNQINDLGKVPWLGDVPILGAFFKSADRTREERELVMVVTPHLVRPIGRNADLPRLPGADADAYSPRFDQFIFQERGNYDQSSFGFSR